MEVTVLNGGYGGHFALSVETPVDTSATEVYKN